MTRYILSRLVQIVVTMFVISIVVFFLVRLTGDPVSVMAPPTFSAQQVEDLRRAWGFDRPLLEQYWTFLSKALTGDFGMSIQYKRPAMELVLQRLGYTYILAIAASLIGLLVALPLGIISAIRRNSAFDLASTVFSTLGTAMPSFWLGIMLILIFSVTLRWLPAFGADSWQALIMPAVALGVGMAARLARLTRSSMLETLRQDYVRTAYSKGLGERAVVTGHVLRNSLLPMVTAFGLQFGWLLGGAVIIEQVFAWPGLGRLMVEAIGIRDITIVQAGLFWFALSFLFISLLIDLTYTFLDPRISFSK